MSSFSNSLAQTTSPANPLPLLESELRFPVVVDDGSVGNIKSEPSSVNMVSRNEEPDEVNSLAGSTYELIDTDVESRDGHATASIASTDVVGPEDDVASIAESEHSDEESETEEQPTRSVPALLSLASTSSFDTPTIGRSSGALFDEYDRPFHQNIEFEEPLILDTEMVSVKHTVEEFNAEKTKNASSILNLHPQPGRLSLTIRQTMSKFGLSTKDPLRILYVGSHSAKEDILRKIGSSLNSSTDNFKQRSTTSQLYNIVQVSAYRSEEIELMHSSGIQLMVEDCVSVESMPFEDTPNKPDVLKLRVDDSSAYHSVPDDDGFIVEPAWELPHIAVFYCSSGDNAEAKRTRSLARKFMNRHGVPSIVISHKTILDRNFCMTLDQHSVHMCLESRDPAKKGSIIHQRLPIDLSSFLNIDARQMNRNLAYISGLHDAPRHQVAATTHKYDTSMVSKEVETLDNTQPNDGSDARTWVFYTRIGMIALALVSLLFVNIPAYLSTSAPAISVNSKTIPAVAISSTTTTAITTPVPSITSVEKIQVVKTFSPAPVLTPSARPNSLSVVPSKEIGNVPKSSSQPVKSNKTVCTTEILGDREILIRIPSTTKLSWLAREAISVNLTRNNNTVDTERVYSSDEGLVLLLAKKDAYGALRLSIVTNKRPRINETFQIEFGNAKSQALQEALAKVYSMVTYDVALIDQTLHQVRDVVHEAVDKTLVKVPSFEEVKKQATGQAKVAGETINTLAKRVSREVSRRSSIISKEIVTEAEKQLAEGYKTAERLRKPLSKGLLKAQVRSKLVWLKLQGKDAEYKEYKKRAADAAILKQDNVVKPRKASCKKRGKKEGSARKCGGNKLHR